MHIRPTRTGSRSEAAWHAVYFAIESLPTCRLYHPGRSHEKRSLCRYGLLSLANSLLRAGALWCGPEAVSQGGFCSISLISLRAMLFLPSDGQRVYQTRRRSIRWISFTAACARHLMPSNTTVYYIGTMIIILVVLPATVLASLLVMTVLVGH